MREKHDYNENKAKHNHKSRAKSIVYFRISGAKKRLWVKMLSLRLV